MRKKVLAWLVCLALALTLPPLRPARADGEITVAGTATDDVAILQIDNQTPSARDKSWTIEVTSGTVEGAEGADLTADLTLTGLPAGLTWAAAKGTGNTIVITLSDAATAALTADAAVAAVIRGSAVTEAGALDSAPIALNLWYVGPDTAATRCTK